MGTIDGVVYLIDMKSRAIVAKLENHGLPVRALSFTSSSKHLISAGEDLHVYVTDTETFQRKRTMVGHTKLITSIACHPQTEDIFITSSCDGTLKIWSM
jgi:WD40 repeat protein